MSNGWADRPDAYPAVADVRNLLRTRVAVARLGLMAATVLQVIVTINVIMTVSSLVMDGGSRPESNPVAWAVIGAWVGLGLILSIPQMRVRRIAFNGRSLREPTHEERALMAPAWSAVARRAGVRESDYGLAISGNGVCRSRGHMIILARNLVQSLTGAQLEAVLAHELGHAMSVGGAMSMAVAWYRIPGLLLILVCEPMYRFTRWFVRFSYYSLRVVLARFLPWPLPMLAAMSTVASCIAFPAVCGLAVVGAWGGLVFVAAAFQAWLFRLCDRWADVVTAELGYGAVMMDLLSRGAQTPDGARVDWWERALGWTLPASVRLGLLGSYRADKGL